MRAVVSFIYVLSPIQKTIKKRGPEFLLREPDTTYRLN